MKRIFVGSIGALLALILTACSTPTAVPQEETGAASASSAHTTSTAPTTAAQETAPTDQTVSDHTAAIADEPAAAPSTPRTAASSTPAAPPAQPTQPSSTRAPAPTSSASRPATTQRPSATQTPATRPTLPSTSAPSATPATQAEQVAALVNEERAKVGLKPLTLSAELSANAQVRAREIVSKFDHVRPDGSAFSTAVTIAWRTVGENIAYGQTSPAAVMQAWMNSSGHRQNILGTGFDTIGVGVVESGGRLYWVQLFTG